MCGLWCLGRGLGLGWLGGLCLVIGVGWTMMGLSWLDLFSVKGFVVYDGDNDELVGKPPHLPVTFPATETQSPARPQKLLLQLILPQAAALPSQHEITHPQLSKVECKGVHHFLFHALRSI